MKRQWKKPVLVYKTKDMPYVGIINYPAVVIQFDLIPRKLPQEERKALNETQIKDGLGML